ncbi:hypothetical protein SC499_21640 [Peribacillus simplex]|uniref:hypothetical protein n=1 Tax=Peribacillus simplex TaxID=1478 RepID=UPI00298E3593|nr:hypothetical protein [Peribacillus simplex]MDW7617209.1 hypothetical protein [Peribacillus simplex]
MSGKVSLPPTDHNKNMEAVRPLAIVSLRIYLYITDKYKMNDDVVNVNTKVVNKIAKDVIQC